MIFLRVLGPVSLLNEDQPATTVSQRKLLALLVLVAGAASRGISRHKLIGLLWPESDESRARNALNQSLHAVRGILDNENAIIGRSELQLNASVFRVDMWEFQSALACGQLERADDLYRGPFLDGFYVAGCPEFGRWVEEQRQRIALAHACALEQLASSAVARKNQLGAVTWWRRCVATDPLSSRLARSYVEALAAAGDPEAAIRHAHTHAELVRTELNAEADPEIVRYIERFRTASPRRAERLAPVS